MKYLITILLLVATFTVSATNKPHAEASAGAAAASTSKSVAASGASASTISNPSVQNTTLTEVETKYDTVSASAASLSLAYCTDGASAQAEEGGFGIAQMNYICEAAAALKVNLMLVDMELEAHKNAHSSDHADWTHINKAHEYMMRAEGIMIDVVSYIEARRETAGMSANAKDITWPLLLIGLLFLL